MSLITVKTDGSIMLGPQETISDLENSVSKIRIVKKAFGKRWSFLQIFGPRL